MGDNATIKPTNPAGVRDFRQIIDKVPHGNPQASNSAPTDKVTIQVGAPATTPAAVTTATVAPAAPAAAKPAATPTAPVMGSASAPKTIQVSAEAAPLVIEAPQAGDAQVEHLENYVPSADSKLIETPTTVENLGWLGRSLRLNENVLMVGQTGVGKTSLVKYLAHLTNNELRRINLSDMTDNTELIGGYKPSKTGGFEWQDGIITEALRKGQWLLLDEINLADPAILERLNSLLDDDRFVVLTEKNNEQVRAHPNTRIFATMNPTSYSGRKELSEAMLNRFHRTYQDPYPPEEMVQILESSSSNKIDKKVLMQMVMTHNTIAELATNRQIGKRDGPYPYTLRDMLKWVDRIKKLDGTKEQTQLIVDEGADIYIDRLQTPADKKAVIDVIKLQLKKEPAADIPARIDKQDAETLKIGDSFLKINPDGGAFVPGEDSKLVTIPTTMKTIDKIARCAMMDEPMLLVGPTAAGKTSMIRFMANQTNNDFRRFNLEHQTDVSEFIGGYIPKPGGKPGEFAWKDGILVDSMRKGHWVVFDEINLAQPSILERINSLLDKDRTITLTEKGNEVVHAHENFRVFATMNPATSQYAGRKELSLAMRNRFTETWVPSITDRNEYLTILKVWMKKLGGDCDKTSEKMIDFHQALVSKVENREIAQNVREGKMFTIRNLKYWSRFIKEFKDEETLGNAFYNGVRHCYANQFPDPKDREAVLALARNYLPQALKAEDPKK